MTFRRDIPYNMPRCTAAKYDSICAETKMDIKKGDLCVYFPPNRVYHMKSEQAQRFIKGEDEERERRKHGRRT